MEFGSQANICGHVPLRPFSLGQSFIWDEFPCPESVNPTTATPKGATWPITASIPLALLTSASTTQCPYTPTKTSQAKTASGGPGLDGSLWGHRISIIITHRELKWFFSLTQFFCCWSAVRTVLIPWSPCSFHFVNGQSHNLLRMWCHL